MQLRVHLTFPGTCEEAFRLYERVLGATGLALLRYGDSPAATDVPASFRDKLVHATLTVREYQLLGADVEPGQYESPAGFYVLLGAATRADAERIFAELADGGEVIPENFHTATPYLVVEGVAKLLDFLQSAFDAREIERHASPDGSVVHAQVRIGDSMIMLGDPTGAQEPWQKPLTAALYLYVPDCDKLYQSALDSGAKSLQEPADMFCGDRHGGVVDPWGNQWWIATHKEDVPPEELQRRAAAHMGS